MTSAKKRILIAEDQKLVGAHLEQTLRKIGYEVVANVASGEQAVAKAIELRPDLALMDIRFPGEMDGIQAAAAIREHIDVPVVYLTAYADEETVERAILTGPFGYVVKPFHEHELRAAIDIAVYKHRTDRLLTQEKVRRQVAEEFKLFVDGVQDYGIFLVDVAGHVVSWNAGAERIKGYRTEEIIGRHFSIFYPAEDVNAGKPQAELDAAEKAGRLEDEGWRVRKDGSRFLANVVITALRDDQGLLRGFGKVVRDVTARRQSELALQESVARSSSMVAFALDAIICIDFQGRVVEWNPTAEQTFGYRRDEAMGQVVDGLIIPERLRARHRQEFLRCGTTGQRPFLGKRMEMPAVTKGGKEIIVELSVARLPVGQTPLFMGFIRDISAQKAAETRLHEKEERQRLLDRATLALAGSLEIGDTIQTASRATVPDLSDWCLIDWVDKGGNWAQVAAAHVDPQQQERARKLQQKLPREVNLKHGAPYVFRTGKPDMYPAPTHVTWTGAPLGSAHPKLMRRLGVLSYLCVPIRFQNKTQGIVQLLRAAPPRRYTADDLGVAQELARRIGLAIENARLFQETQDAVRARDEFLQIASHELKTPLTPLQLQLDTLTRTIEKLVPENERLCSRMKMATRQTTRLGRLVESLLDVSRITTGHIALEIEEVDLAELVQDIAERFRGEAIRAGSTIVVHADRPMVGRGDQLRLDQIISNLISNAIKYGSGKPIDVRLRASTGTARVSVTDRGIGISKADLSRIFDRFERAESLRHYGGLGLGLFIARQLAEAHGGTIVTESQPGRGSTFTLILPSVPDSKRQAHCIREQ